MAGMDWRIVTLVVLVAAAAGVGAAMLLGREAPLTLRSGTALDAPRSLAEFTLVDPQGGAFTREDFEGRWSLLFAGFTNCPDICPLTLAQFAEIRKRLPEGRLQLLFLSVDPERDTPERVGQYLAHFGPGLAGATGAPEAVAAFAAQLGLAHVKIPGADGNYTVDHSAALVLIDPRARIAGYFTPPHDTAALVADLSRLPAG
ncbi:MAG: SCO family protein [Gammaproteobacteria bacterium]